jgi:hypothetical protein
VVDLSDINAVHRVLICRIWFSGDAALLDGIAIHSSVSYYFANAFAACGVALTATPQAAIEKRFGNIQLHQHDAPFTLINTLTP